MAKTYLNLCQDFVKEYGIAGGSGPSTIVGQTGELSSVVNWIAESDLYVASLWQDWKFLWNEYSQTLTSGSGTIPPATNAVRRWDTRKFFLDKTADTWSILKYVSWPEFDGLHNVGTRPSARPAYITIKPDNSLAIDALPDAAYAITGEYWAAPTRMENNTDEPDMPDQYRRIIIARAAIMYGNREDAPEIISGAEAEYMDLLEKLESAQLSSQENRRMSEDDMDLTVEIPDMY